MQKNIADALPNDATRIRFEAALKQKKYQRPLFWEIWVICYGLGLRIGDALALRFCDIDTYGRVTFTPEKQKRLDKDGNPRQLRTVTVTANKRVKEVINKRKKQARTGQIYVFESPYGQNNGRRRPYTRGRVWKVWKDAGARIGLTDINVSTHTARKTIGRKIYYGTGHDIGQTCEALYQTDPRATMHYLGVKNDQVNAVLDAFGQ